MSALPKKIKRKPLKPSKEKLSVSGSYFSVNKKERLFKDILEGIDHPFYIVNAKDYTIEIANSAAKRLGIKKNKKCFSSFSPDNYSLCIKITQSCPLETIKKTKKPETVERFYTDEKGNVCCVELNGYPIFDEVGNVKQVIEHIVDITERKKTEQELEKTQERLMQAQQIAHLGNWDWNILTNELWWSDEVYRIFDLKIRQLAVTYEAFLNRVHPEDRSLVKKAVNEALYENKNYSIEHRIILPDGKQKIVHEQGKVFFNDGNKPIRMVGIIQDITERKFSEDIIRSIAEGTAALHSDKLFQLLARHLASILQVKYVIITKCVNPQMTRVRSLAFWNGNDFDENFEYDLIDTPCEGVLNKKICYYPDDIQKHFPKDEGLVKLKVRSYLGIPLFDSSGTALGHIAAFDINPMKNKFQKLPVLQTFSTRISSELERKKLEEDIEFEKRKLEEVLSIDQEIRSILKLNHLVDFIIDKATEILNAERCSLMLLDPKSNKLLIRGSKGLSAEIIKKSRIKLGDQIAGRVAKSGNPILVQDIEENTFISRKNRSSYNSKSFMSVPIKAHDELIGVVNVSDKKSKNGEVFTKIDLKVLCTIVRQASIAIENASYYRELEHLSITDPLTELFNHRHFMRSLNQELTRLKRYPKPLCLLMIDIDNFKSYNDLYGHLEGDHLLKKVSNSLKKNSRAVDIVCRYAGDEFAIILPEINIFQAKVVAMKIKNSMVQLKLKKEITISVGLAVCDKSMLHHDLIRKADQALYQAKKEGKNKIFSLE